MVSVTPDIVSSTFQAPSPRAKADPPAGNDGFAALVDSNIAAAANNNDRAQDASPAPLPAASDKRPAAARRDDTAAADKPRDIKAGNSAPGNERDAAAANPADAGKPAETDTIKPAKSKSADNTNDAEKSAGEPSSDGTATTHPADTPAVTDQAGIATTDAIATAIIVPVVATEAPAAVTTALTPAASSGLPVVTAAVNAVSTVGREAAAPAVAAPDTTDTDVATVAADTKTVTQAIADQNPVGSGRASPAGEPAKTADTASTAAATAIPAAPKTAASQKPASNAGAKPATTSDEVDVKVPSSDAPAADVPIPAVAAGIEQADAAKAAVKNAHAPTAKTEPAGAQTSSVTAAHLTTAASTDLPSSQASVPGSGAPAAALFQTQLQTTAPQQQSSFTVTAATPSTAVPVSGLALEIAASVQSGKSRFEIRLDPAELGRIDVRIDVDRHGQMISHLTVEKPETLSLLRQDAPQLQRALNEAGLSTGDAGLQFSLRDQSSSGQNGNQSNPNAQRLLITEDDAIPAAVANSYARMLGSSGGVDIRV